MLNQQNKRRIWLVFIGLCIYQCIGSGLIVNSYGILMKPISASQNISITQMSLAYSARILCGAFATQLCGTLLKRINSKLYFTIMSIGFGLCAVGFSVSSIFPQFVVLAAILGIFLGLGVYMVMPLICNEWFEEPSRYIGIAGAMSGLSGIIFSPILALIIENLGWRMGYAFVGTCCFLIMLPCGLFLIRYSPKDLNMKPLPVSPKDKTADTNLPTVSPSVSYTFKEAIRMPQFYTLAFLIALMPILSVAYNNHFPTMMSVKGFSTTISASLFSVVSAGNVIVPITLGVIIPKIGIKKSLTTYLCIGFIGILGILIIPSSNPLVIAPFAFLTAFARLDLIGSPLLIRDAFGSEHYTDIYPRLQVISYFTGSLVVSLFGILYDTANNYTPCYLLILIAIVISILLISATLRISAKQRIVNQQKFSRQ